MPKMSIIVPVYNTGKYLNKCIESLISQTLKDIEIIIINDGSTDNSDSIIKSYKDKRIRYFSKKNEGIGITRNLGIRKSTGDFLMFIDSDDYIANDCVEKMYNYAVKTNSDIVISDFYKDIEGQFEEIKITNFDSSSLRNNPNIINIVNLGPCNKIYSRKSLKNVFFEENLKYEDAPFVIKALKNASKISKLNECLSYYVIHNNSQTTTRDVKMHDILEIIQIIKNTLSDDIYHNALTNLVTTVLTDYTIQQRYVKDKKTRNKFIDDVFLMLDETDQNWRKNGFVKSSSKIKKFIKTHKTLVKFYCSIYAKFK